MELLRERSVGEHQLEYPSFLILLNLELQRECWRRVRAPRLLPEPNSSKDDGERDRFLTANFRRIAELVEGEPAFVKGNRAFAIPAGRQLPLDFEGRNGPLERVSGNDQR